jgi:hypothetical protein
MFVTRDVFCVADSQRFPFFVSESDADSLIEIATLFGVARFQHAATLLSMFCLSIFLAKYRFFLLLKSHGISLSLCARSYYAHIHRRIKHTYIPLVNMSLYHDLAFSVDRELTINTSEHAATATCIADIESQYLLPFNGSTHVSGSELKYLCMDLREDSIDIPDEAFELVRWTTTPFYFINCLH